MLFDAAVHHHQGAGLVDQAVEHQAFGQAA